MSIGTVNGAKAAHATSLNKASRHVGIRGKILGFAAIIVLIALGAIYLLARTLVLDSFIQLEQQETTEDVNRVLNTVSSEIVSLVGTTLDWSNWDDTYHFVQGSYPDYVTANLGDSVFTSLGLNMMVFVDTSGKVVYAKGFDLLKGEETDVPASLLAEFNSSEFIKTRDFADKPVIGILRNSGSPLILISEPILTSTNAGPSAGRVYFGRYLDNSEVLQIGQRNLLNLKLYSLDDQGLPADVQTAAQHVSTDIPTYTQPVDQSTSGGYGLVNDIYGKPALIFRVNVPRDIYHQGENTISYLFIALTILLVVSGGILLLLLDRVMLARLLRLSDGLAIVRESGSPSLRVPVEGHDELGNLADTINETLESLEQSHATLFANQELLKTVITSAPLILFAVDLSGKVTLLEGKGLNTLGMKPDEIVGHSAADESSPMADLYKNIQPGLLDTASSTVTLGNFTFDVRYTALRDANGVIQGVAGVATDISDRKRAQQERLEAERVLLELKNDREVLTVKERFISTLSHEFRSPLSVILAAKESLQYYYDRMNPERRAEHFQNIEEQTRRMLLLLDDLLTISKTSDGKMQFAPLQMDLVPLCWKLFEEVRMTDQLQRHFIFVCDKPALKAHTDKRLLRHIIVNLLSNAVKYSPVDGEIRFELAQTDDEVVIHISDQGIGIPETDQAHLFEPYYRATNTGSIQGTGLGLTIVKECVEAHGGTIMCESEQDKGTTFVVRLPIEAGTPTSTSDSAPVVSA